MKIILLDIDGVVSIDRADYSDERELAQASIPNKNSTHRIHNYRLDVVYALNNLAKSGLVEIQYLSNWGDAAADVFAKYVGLEGIEPVKHSFTRYAPDKIELATEPLEWYKPNVVFEKVSAGYDAMLIDDKITVELAVELDARLPKTSGWIRTHPSQGLTQLHIDRLKAWASGGPAIRYHKGEKW